MPLAHHMRFESHYRIEYIYSVGIDPADVIVCHNRFVVGVRSVEKLLACSCVYFFPMCGQHIFIYIYNRIRMPIFTLNILFDNMHSGFICVDPFVVENILLCSNARAKKLLTNINVSLIFN